MASVRECLPSAQAAGSVSISAPSVLHSVRDGCVEGTRVCAVGQGLAPGWSLHRGAESDRLDSDPILPAY